MTIEAKYGEFYGCGRNKSQKGFNFEQQLQLAVVDGDLSYNMEEKKTKTPGTQFFIKTIEINTERETALIYRRQWNRGQARRDVKTSSGCGHVPGREHVNSA